MGYLAKRAGRSLSELVSAGSKMTTDGEGTYAIEPAGIGLLSLALLIKLRMSYSVLGPS